MKANPKWVNQYKVLPNQSKFHEKVRAILSQGWFAKYYAYQEVAVADICEDYESGLHRFDWYIPALNLVIELHGRQHYKFTNRGNISYNEAMQQFKDGQKRDKRKKIAAIEAGYDYVEIPYTQYKKLDEKKLRELIGI